LKAKAKGIEEAILDIGLQSPSKGTRSFAVLKGVSDAEITIPHSIEKLPSESRIEGKHIMQHAKNLSPELKKQNIFSKYSEKNVSPEELDIYFIEFKKKLLSTF
jgi:large subunit ribosomal protein L18